MSKKGIVIASAVAAAVILGGCSKPQPMPKGPMASQAGPSAKLGKMGRTSCKGYHRCSGKK